MIRTIKPALPGTTREAARSLRKAMTDAGRRPWKYLRAGRLCDWTFRRQHPAPPRVVDLCCIEVAWVVELDGSQHDAQVDAERTRYLQAQGRWVVRYCNHDVVLRTDAVLEEIERIARSRTLSPIPLPEGEGL